MNEDDEPALVPFSSWFGPIRPWRLCLLAVLGAGAYVLFPLLVDHARPSPWWLLVAVAVGALLGVPMGRQDARGTLHPRRGSNGRLVWPGLVAFVVFGVALVSALTLAETTYLYVPLLLVAMGPAAITAAWSRDRLLAAGTPTS